MITDKAVLRPDRKLVLTTLPDLSTVPGELTVKPGLGDTQVSGHQRVGVVLARTVVLLGDDREGLWVATIAGHVRTGKEHLIRQVAVQSARDFADDVKVAIDELGEPH
ncbi:MAG: hypothetical protein ACXV5E_09155 [Halobacteriota archaeon]